MILISLGALYVMYVQGEVTLMLLVGAGIPMYIYLIYISVKRMNKIELQKDYFTLKHPFLSERKIRFQDVKIWDENSNYQSSKRTLRVYTAENKFVILSVVDEINYFKLLGRLKHSTAETTS